MLARWGTGLFLRNVERVLTMMIRTLLAAATMSLASLHAAAGEPTVHVSVGGQISPGVYGRVDFGNAPPPPVLYPSRW